MKVQLINEPNRDISPIFQILLNRGVDKKNILNYLHTSDNDINKPSAFGEELMLKGVRLLASHIEKGSKCLVVVDCDCDGYTSSAILINYLHDMFPAYCENNLSWYIHSGKQHGLSDCIDEAMKYKLVILPDSSSNDYDYHKQLDDNGTDVLVLDHHEAEKVSEYALVINNQLSEYPNKHFSGAGVVWQFCRFIDSVMQINNAEQYIDLCALGNIADMMSMTSLETKHIIMSGIEKISNPFFEAIVEKHSFSIGDKVTPYGVAFYVAPYVNAMVRSGTQEEKELLFKSMLKHKAYEKIPSNKRGHKQGDMETVLAQAMRTVTNVKNRQTRAQNAGMELLEKMIESNNLLDHKVLLFLLKPGQIDRSIAGLVANKLMSKYQRPCCVLTEVRETFGVDENTPPWDDAWKDYDHVIEKISWQGSARGYDKSGFTNFKDLCSMAPGVMYAQGHQGAFGLGIYDYTTGEEEVAGECLYQFLDFTDEALKDLSSEPMYLVDYLFDFQNCNIEELNKTISEISHLGDLWGKDMDESLIAIKNIEISEDMVQIYEKRDNTIKVNLPNGINLMKFHATDEECDLFKRANDGLICIDVVGTCNENEWQGITNSQLFIEDYEVIYQTGYAPSVSDF